MSRSADLDSVPSADLALAMGSSTELPVPRRTEFRTRLSARCTRFGCVLVFFGRAASCSGLACCACRELLGSLLRSDHLRVPRTWAREAWRGALARCRSIAVPFGISQHVWRGVATVLLKLMNTWCTLPIIPRSWFDGPAAIDGYEQRILYLP